MGNGIGKLKFCFAGDVGEISKRRHDIGIDLHDSLDKGLGHSFCYILHDSSSKNHPFLDDSSYSATTTISSNSSSSRQTTMFRTISGASISANTSTPLSTAPVDVCALNSNTYIEKSSAFESSQWFSSFPLQPINRRSIPSVSSGPIPRVSVSGPIERGFLSGPIDRSFTSGLLDNQYDQQLQRYKPEPSTWDLVRNLKKVLSSSLLGFQELNLGEKNNEINNLLSSENGFDEDDEDSDLFRSQNVQWAQGKAGEDRVHVVISEEHGWVFVGIYDGFNGPDATEFLLNNLYSNVFKELKGLLWNDKLDTSENLMCNDTTIIQNNQEFDQSNLEMNSYNSGAHHLDVLKALSEALRRAGASYLEITDMMVNENPELALMGSCVLVMLMKGKDVYLMNVGDSRAVLAQNPEPDRFIGNLERINEENQSSIDALYRVDSYRKHNLSSCQLTMDHSTSVKEEVLRIRKAVSEVETFMSIFSEGDPAQHLVEEVLFRAAKKAGMNFHELLDIPQGDRRKYHDDVSIIIISFEGRIWRSSV
ncbi:hypothetical protein RND71_003830 [Anisodus tanguticus]|uniref:PPM-type phosphatase domain-containing protein n=1 Tax=Anisodus tanguticus TaxID=243964 RepID=A0AAE1SVB3_9SOLA|nr:hypothetical protein RND71_003830 [Anisodus tanguticus]